MPFARNETPARRAGRCASAAVLALSAALGLAGCGKAPDPASGSSNASASTSVAAAAATASAAPAASPAAAADTPLSTSLVSLSSGAYIVQKPQEYSGAYASLDMLDEHPVTNWTAPKGVLTDQTMVVALAERSLLKTVQFDCKDAGLACARHISVEVSDQGPTSGFVRIANVELAESGNNQTFPVAKPAPGRWVKLVIRDNHGSPDYLQLNDFRAGGDQLTHTPAADVSGTYKTSLGEMHMRQEGTSITGCYYTRGGVFTGGVEGHLVKIKWCDNCALPSKETGPADIVFSPQGDRFVGLYWGQQPNSRSQGKWEGERVSRDIGSCPQWAGGAQAQLSQDLATNGRAQLDGVNFETDSDRLRPESNGALDRAAAVLKAKPALKVRVEGHTDAVAGAAYNLDLSQRRAAAVADYLKHAGIEASRLSTVGFGSDKPIASNDTGLGRAQNRRVELAVQ